MIRIATEADVPAILAIYAPYILRDTCTFEYDVPELAEFAQRFRTITAQFPFLVLVEDGELLGYAYAGTPFSRTAFSWCAESSVYLRTDAHGRGYGKRLICALEQLLTIQGYRVLYARITAENRASVALHQRLGYSQIGYFPACGFKFGRWLDLLWLEKRLAPSGFPSNRPISWNTLRQDTQKFSDILDTLSLS